MAHERERAGREAPTLAGVRFPDTPGAYSPDDDGRPVHRGAWWPRPVRVVPLDSWADDSWWDDGPALAGHEHDGHEPR